MLQLVNFCLARIEILGINQLIEYSIFTKYHNAPHRAIRPTVYGYH